MKTYALCSLLAFGGLAALNTQAQVTEVDVAIELVYQDDGTVAGYPEGYNTWRIYAELENAGDFLSAVYATVDAPALSIASSTNHIWNSAGGGPLGTDISTSTFATDPAAEYDSWVTIGADNNASGAWLSQLATEPSATVIGETFGTAGTSDEIDENLNVVDGAWFTLITSTNGFAVGDDNRVLIGQITTDGDLSVCMNFQVFPGGVSGELTAYDNYCSTALAPLSISEQTLTPAALAPNPSNGDSQLFLDATASVEAINVRNITGQLVMNLQPPTTTVNLPGSTLEHGIYLVEVLYGDLRRETLRWVVR